MPSPSDSDPPKSPLKRGTLTERVSEKSHLLPYTKGDRVLTFTKKQGFGLGHGVTFFTFQTPSEFSPLLKGGWGGIWGFENRP